MSSSQDVLTESSQDGQQEIVSTPKHDQSQRKRFKCTSCDNPNKVCYCYGLHLCFNCQVFICKVARKKRFSFGCIGGLGNCRTTYSAGRHIKCQSCRVKRMMKLNIQNPAWNRFIAQDQIKCETPDHPKQPDYCAGCHSHNNVLKSYGVHLCYGCQFFIRNIAKNKFKVKCIGRQSNCRTTYKAGYQIKCSSCRLKKMMKLDIQHPAWVTYKAEHGIDRETSHGGPPRPRSDDDVEDRKYEPGVDRQQKLVPTFNYGPSRREQLKCDGCDNPHNVAKHYGLNLCRTCRMAVFIIARRKFEVNCIGGLGVCRTTYKPGQPMMCRRCRLDKFLKLDIKHPAWIKYKAKLKIRYETLGSPTSSDKEIYDAGGESISSSSDDGCECDSCYKFENCGTHHGLKLCSGCDQFIYTTAKKNTFSVKCITGLEECRTTYKAGDKIRCSSCRIKRIIKLKIQHPVWVKYKAEHTIKDETIDDLASPGEEMFSDDDGEDVGEKKCSPSESSIDDREAIMTSGSQRKLSKCAGCNSPTTVIKAYGLNFCPGCRWFIKTIAKKNFEVNCIGGEESCRVTYLAGKHMRCAHCRVKRLLQLDISHPAWVRYKTEQMIENETHKNSASRVEELAPEIDDVDDIDKESLTSSSLGTLSNVNEFDEVEDETTVRIAYKSLIGPGEDCDADDDDDDDDNKMIEINCN